MRGCFYIGSSSSGLAGLVGGLSLLMRCGGRSGLVSEKTGRPERHQDGGQRHGRQAGLGVGEPPGGQVLSLKGAMVG